ncbi:MAG: hypothetical protein ABSG25_01640 [Bryobacteraceae bacterium]
MSDKFRLLIVVTKATLLVESMCIPLVLVLGRPPNPLDVPSNVRIAGRLTLTFLLPIGLAAWWMFRKLQARYTRREARAVAIAYGVFTPVSLGIAVLPSTMLGGCAAQLLGNAFGAIGAVAGVIVLTALISFVPCVLALKKLQDSETEVTPP